MKLKLWCRDEITAMKLAMSLRAFEKDCARNPYGELVVVDSDNQKVMGHILDALFDGRVEEARG